jgi:hypothetical protein
MRIATWDVGILYRAGAVNEMVREMCKYKIDIHVFCKNVDGQEKEV